MSTHHHRETALTGISLMSQRRWSDVFDLVADGGTFEAMNCPEGFVYGGRYTKAQGREMLHDFTRHFDTFTMQPVLAVAEGDHVIIENRVRGFGPGEASYTNDSVMIMTFTGDEIQSIRCYLDPHQVMSYVDQLAVRAALAPTERLSGA